MLKQNQEQVQFLARIADFVATLGAFFIAYEIRAHSDWFTRVPLWSLDPLYWMLVASLVIHLIVYPVMGFYESLRKKSYFEIFWMTLKASTIEFFLLGSVVFFFQLKDTSRAFFFLFLAVNTGLIVLQKVTVKSVLHSLRKRGYNLDQLKFLRNG